MEDLQIKLNTLNSLIPAKMPYVLGQVNEAIKLAENCEGFERNLGIAIEIAQQLANFYKDDMLMYNYKPIVVALLLNVGEDADLSAFDTIGHEVPVALATVRQFLATYPLRTKEYATEFPKFLGMPDVATVILANLKADVLEDKNLINIGYILLANNQTANNVVNEVRTMYYDLKAEAREKQF